MTYQKGTERTGVGGGARARRREGGVGGDNIYSLLAELWNVSAVITEGLATFGPNQPAKPKAPMTAGILRDVASPDTRFLLRHFNITPLGHQQQISVLARTTESRKPLEVMCPGLAPQ